MDIKSTDNPQSFNSGQTLRARGFRLATPPLHFVCVDPSGDGDDNTACIMSAREEHQKGEPQDPDFSVEHMHRIKMALRIRQDQEFTDVLAQLYRLHRFLLQLRAKGLSAGHVFAIETNGVGYGYAKALRAKIPPSALSIFEYHTVGNMSDDTDVMYRYAMPRLAGLDNLRILIETHHLKIDKNMPGAKEYEEEFRAFIWKSPNRPEALEGQHDDLVMATAGALWVATKIVPPILRQDASVRKRGIRYHNTSMRVQ